MTSPKALTIDQIVEYYVKLRDKKTEITHKMREATEDISANMKALEALILSRAVSQGVTSFKTAHGTAFLETTATSSVKDWDALLAFVKENDAYHMLNKAVSKTRVKEYLDEYNVLPPGVKYDTRKSVKVRRS